MQLTPHRTGISPVSCRRRDLRGNGRRTRLDARRGRGLRDEIHRPSIRNQEAHTFPMSLVNANDLEWPENGSYPLTAASRTRPWLPLGWDVGIGFC